MASLRQPPSRMIAPMPIPAATQSCALPMRVLWPEIAVADDTHIYWTDKYVGVVRRAALDGGTRETVRFVPQRLISGTVKILAVRLEGAECLSSRAGTVSKFTVPWSVA